MAAPVDSPGTPAADTRNAAAFMLPDVGGVQRSLADYRGHAVALFFFCGCDLCHQCGRDWREVMAGGQLEQIAAAGIKPGSPARAANGVVTLIVFGGDADGAKAFAKETGLDPAKVVLLQDPQEVVSDLYVVDSCPRAFVIDGGGVIRYTNTNKKSTDLPVDLLVARTLDAIRTCYSSNAPKHGAADHANH